MLNTRARVFFYDKTADVAFFGGGDDALLAEVRTVLKNANQPLADALEDGEAEPSGLPILWAKGVARKTVEDGLAAMATAGMVPVLPELHPDRIESYLLSAIPQA